MKKILAFILFLYTVAVAQASETKACSQTLQNMVEVGRSYLDVLRSCHEIKNKSEYKPLYVKFSNLARKYEKIYNRYSEFCYQECEDNSSCEWTLSGACE